MIQGIGTDLVQIDRFEAWLLQPDLMGRYFDKDELAACTGTSRSRAASLAARFAAKEAFGKALGTGMRGLVLRDISVTRDHAGKPSLALKGTAAHALQVCIGDESPGPARVHVSLSHDNGCALAFVVIETVDKE